MDAARLTFADNGFAIAVAVRFMPDPIPPNHRHTHTGICYRSGGSLWLLHLAWDRKLEHEPFDGSYLCAVLPIRPRRLPFLLRLFHAMRDKRPILRYALRHADNARFLIQSNGEVVLTKAGAGLNCSTFVLVVFQSYGLRLVDLATWQPRAEDAVWHQHLVTWVSISDPVHAAVIASEIGCARVRPEETTGACLEDKRPAAFVACDANGCHVLRVLNGHLTPAEHPAAEVEAYYAWERRNGHNSPHDPTRADEDFCKGAGVVVAKRPHGP